MSSYYHRHERLTCQCGGEISRPLPSHCPHCGRRIAAVVRRPAWLNGAIVLGLFAVLGLFLWWLVRLIG